MERDALLGTTSSSDGETKSLTGDDARQFMIKRGGGG